MADFRKCFLVLALVMVAAATCQAQSGMIYMAGASYAPGAETKLAGTALAIKPVTEAGTAAFVALDGVPTSTQPLNVTSNVGVGIAQRVVTLKMFNRDISVWVPTSAGISWTGSSVGWQWNGGGLVHVPIKGAWGIDPNVRFLKSSVNNNSDFQVIGGVFVSFNTGK